MDVCDGGYGDGSHTEVCYTSRECPMCKLMQDIEERDTEIKKLQKEIDEHECPYSDDVSKDEE